MKLSRDPDRRSTSDDREVAVLPWDVLSGKGLDGNRPKPKEPKLETPDNPLAKTNDPVRIYLREMGTVPLLTRKGEVSIARRIERGEKRIVGAISCCSYVHAELRLLADLIPKGQVSPNLFASSAEEEGPDAPQKRLTRARQRILKTHRLLGKIETADRRLRRLKPGGRAALSTRWCIARLWVQVTREFRILRMVPSHLEHLARTISDADRKIKRHERQIRDLVINVVEHATRSEPAGYDRWFESLQRLHDQAVDDRLRGMAISELRMLIGEKAQRHEGT